MTNTNLTTKIMYVFIAIAIIAGVARLFIDKQAPNVTCPAVIEMCGDGSSVGPTGPKCEFICPDKNTQATASEQSQIEAKADLIQLDNIGEYSIISDGQVITGQARGPWYFEASFPITLALADGTVLVETYATAKNDWMTEDFVPFTATLNFKAPQRDIPSNEMRLGKLILRKDNPSGLPENDKVNAEGREGALGYDALEIPIRFAP